MFGKKEKQYSFLLNFVNSINTPLLREYIASKNIETLYYENHQLQKIISIIARNIAKLNIYAVDSNGNLVENSKTLKLLENNDNYTINELLEITVRHLELYGNAYWYINNSNIIILYPPAVRVVLNENRSAIKNYTYLDYTFNVDEIVHFKYPSIKTPFLGESPAESVRVLLVLDTLIDLYNIVFFQNGAVPSFVLKTSSTLSDIERERLKKELQLFYEGAKNAFKTMLLEGDMTIQPLGEQHKDISFLEMKKWIREELLATFQVPPVLAGVFEYANYANSLQQRKQFYEECITPRVRLLENTINKQLASRLEKNVKIRFDTELTEIALENLAQKIQIASQLWVMGMSLEQINNYLDLDLPLTGGGVGEVGEELELEALKMKWLKDKNNKQLRYNLVKKSFVYHQEQIEKKAKKEIRNYFSRIFEDILRLASETLEGQEQKAFEIDYEKLLELEQKIEKYIKEKADKELRELLLQIYKEALNLALQHLKYTEISFNSVIWEAKINTIIADSASKVTRINDTIRKQLREAIEKAIKESLTVHELKSEIERVGIKAKRRSLTIARTETATVMNRAIYEVMKESEYKYKIWLTAHDEAVRETHRKQDYMKIPILSYFPNGLSYPGDQTANKPKETINCRCTLIFE